MPLTVARTRLATPLADLARADAPAAEDARHAIDWMTGGEDSGVERISLHILQDFLWYQLPRKWLCSPEEHLQVADALARLFDRLGKPGRPYAGLCRSDVTTTLLHEWYRDARGAMETYRLLREVSPVEPPSTRLLEWGAVMGVDEATLYEETAQALEEALGSGELDLDKAEFASAQIAVTERFLDTPRPDLDGNAPVDVIRRERLEAWARGASEPSRRIRESVVDQLVDPPPPTRETCARAIEPLRWLLAQAEHGIELTKTGALARAFVRKAVERYPDWWDTPVVGPPYQEAEVRALADLDELLRGFRLVRRHKGRLKATRLGHQALAEPVHLWALTVEGLIPSTGFGGAVQELVAAALLADPGPTTMAHVTGRVHAAIVADGWASGGEPPQPREVGNEAWVLVNVCRTLGLLRLVGKWPARTLVLEESGRMTLRHALHARATRARHSII